MLRTVILGLILCVGLGVCQSDDHDLAETYLGYEFIFHDSKDLGLVVHGNSCYFIPIPDSKEDLHPAAVLCEADLVSYNGSCYKFFPQHVSHDVAMRRCQDEQSHLVEITSSQELQFVHALLMYHFFQDAKVWIGLDDHAHEGTFVLTSSGQSPGFWVWDRGQPDNAFPGQNCVFMNPWAGLWVDGFCWAGHAFVCEK